MNDMRPPIEAYEDLGDCEMDEPAMVPDLDTMARDAATLARLAAMTDIDFDRASKAEAAAMGISVGTLRRQRNAARQAARPKANADAPEFSDDFLALRFTARFADRLRYTAIFGKWNEWTGTHWQPDNTVSVFDKARKICREVAMEAPSEDAGRIASAATVAAVERLARNDRRHAATSDQWDSNPWLLNTPDGTVDLRTGNMRQHSPDDHLTMITAVAPGGECPTWQAFLHRVTDGHGDMQDFLQRVAGYSLTGLTSEHAIFFAYGTGGNGKGVFLNALTGILHDYASVAGMETFTASHLDRHPTELAMLRGARLVTAQETEEGRKWAESKIKALTGGDPITARFMHKDFFTFQPAFKLIVAGNHKPGLRNVDEAIRRRFHLIPFTVTIPAEERDLHLPEKLKAEWPGILAWAIEGCLHWQRIGLAPPEAVRGATDEYLSSEDATGQWLAERCNTDKALWGASSALYADWKSWADRNGEFAGSQRRFSQALEGRGFIKQDMRHGKGFMGLALATEGRE